MPLEPVQSLIDAAQQGGYAIGYFESWDMASFQGVLDAAEQKVNYGTYIKQRCLKALREALNVEVRNPHLLLGIGGDQDLLELTRMTVRDAVLERFELLGCCGKG